jgi:hypothetical protein
VKLSEGESVSLMTKILKTFLNDSFPSLITIERKLAGILMQKFNQSGD